MAAYVWGWSDSVVALLGRHPARAVMAAGGDLAAGGDPRLQGRVDDEYVDAVDAAIAHLLAKRKCEVSGAAVRHVK